MSISIKENYNAAVIELKGKLTGGTLASEMNEALHKLIDKGMKNVVVDMRDVKFMNSSGMGILISGLTTIRNGGGDLKLANISQKIEGLLSITKLNQIFEQYDSVDKAAQSFK